MIAAALIPAAATVGIATAWGFPRIAAGSLFLLVLTVVLINLSAYLTLQRFPYRPEESGWFLGAESRRRLVGLVLTVVIVVGVLGAVGVASYQQISFERNANQAAEATLDQPEYDSMEVVSVQSQYGGPGAFSDPETVTVIISCAVDGDPPSIAGELEDRIAAATDRNVVVRVRFREYQHSRETGTG